MTQANLGNGSKTIAFYLENKNSEFSLQDADQLIKNIQGITFVQIDPSSGEAKIALEDDSMIQKKLIEIQRALDKIGYLVTAKNTNGVQAVLFFGTMTLGFLFVAVVITLFYYFGSLPTLVQ